MVSRRRIDRLTARITEYRLWRHIRRAEQLKALEAYVALEFKGIKANSLRLMANHSKLSTVLADAVESSDKLISHVGDFKGMSDSMIEDIEFAANVLGNSAGASTEAVQPPKPPPVTFQAAVDPVIQQPPAASPATILNGSPGMRAEYQAARADVQLIRS